MSVCMLLVCSFVCLSVCLSARMSRKRHDQTHRGLRSGSEVCCPCYATFPDGNYVGSFAAVDKQGTPEETFNDVVLRYCVPKGTQTDDKCKLASTTDLEVSIAGTRIKLERGKACTCAKDLCNSAPSIGHLASSFVGLSTLLALTAARFISQ